ncbi:hypothetical protein [Mesorhizobium sp. M0323]|uniref:hypothetical protein n=1 Tax=unclassified Mesorhizobium TaxID=325217 RepID=UPI00333ABCE6
MGKQFNLFLSHRDEIVFNHALSKGVENIVFVKPSIEDGDTPIFWEPIREEERSFKNRRVLISSKDFLNNIVLECDAENKCLQVSSRLSPVIEYDINLWRGDVMLPGRMYYNLDWAEGDVRKAYDAYFSRVFKLSKSNLNKIRNSHGSVIYLGNEMMPEFYNETMDFRLL